MNIAVVSNLYPPHAIGGYEQGCRDVVDGLRALGHSVSVLTSNYGIFGYQREEHVYRWLDFQPTWYSQLLSSRDVLRHQTLIVRNWRRVKQFLFQSRSQILVFFQCAALPLPIIIGLTKLSCPVTYFLSDMWLRDFITANQSSDWYSFWARTPHRKVSRALKTTIRSIVQRLMPKEIGTQLSPLVPQSAIFTSQSLHEEYKSSSVVPDQSRVIHWGVQAGQWQSYPPRSNFDNHLVRLLYAGRVNERKGVHILLQAIDILVNHREKRNLSLTIVGNCEDEHYRQELESIIGQGNLEPYVHWQAAVPRTDMPGIYASHQVLVFPSLWKEPFSIALLEAMASSLAIVGTNRGGSSEILVNDVNAIVYDADRPEELADAICNILDTPQKAAALGNAARQTIHDRFRIEVMVEAVENFLFDVLCRPVLGS